MKDLENYVMGQISDKNKIGQNQAFDLTFQALLTEFTAMREASLSRDQIIGNLDNFMMVVLSSALVSIPSIIDKNLFFIFPIVSFVLAAIGIAHHRQLRILHRLGQYEEEVLHKTLTELLGQVSNSEFIAYRVNKLWRWQHFYREKDNHGSFVPKLARRLTTGGIEVIYVLTSIGFLALFVFLRGINNLSLLEIIVFTISSIYSIWLLLIFGRIVFSRFQLTFAKHHQKA